MHSNQFGNQQIGYYCFHFTRISLLSPHYCISLLFISSRSGQRQRRQAKISFLRSAHQHTLSPSSHPINISLISYLLNVDQVNIMNFNMNRQKTSDQASNFSKRSFYIICSKLMERPLRIRKNINSLSEPEYHQYHILLRLLFICEPNEQEKRMTHQVQLAGQDSLILQPQSLYDVVLSIHATCCEHGRQFFPYWHRFLMNRFQELLERAHEYALQLTTEDFVKIEANRLKNVAVRNLLNPNEEDIKTYLLKVGHDYIHHISKLQKDPKTYIAAHYWQIMDYSKKIQYAKGFYRKRITNKQNQHSYERQAWDNGLINADHLIKLIYNQQGIYELNYKTRWYRQKLEIALDKDTGQLYNQFSAPPTIEQCSKLIQDKQFWKDPDNNISVFKQNIGYALIDSQNYQYNYLNQKSIGRRFETLESTSIVQLNPLDNFDVNYIFGGEGNEYISNQQLKSGAISSSRNSLIPYVMYASSLKTKPFDFIKKYCTTRNSSVEFSMENPHNFMHNYQTQLMSDSHLSPNNPIFFAYHSFIDLMLQIKVKFINKDIDPSETEGARQECLSGIRQFMNQEFSYKEKTFQEAWAKYFQQINQKKPLNSDYPVFQWVNPSALDGITEITDQDFIIGQQPYSNKNQTYLHEIVCQQKLRQIEEYRNVKYDINILDKEDPFISRLYDVIRHVDSPYPVAEDSWLSLKVSYNSNIKSKNGLVKIKGSRGNILKTSNLSILSRQNGARNCPSCGEYKSLNLYFDMKQIHNQLPEINNLTLIEVFQDRNFGRSGFRIIPRSKIQDILFFQTNHPGVSISPRVGRQQVQIRIPNAKQFDIGILKIKYKDDTDIENPSSEIQTYQVENKQPVLYEKKGYLIQSVQAFILSRRDLILEYKFSLFAEFCSLEIKFPQKQEQYRTPIIPVQRQIGMRRIK